jgi:Fe2+ transport system protein FeoA
MSDSIPLHLLQTGQTGVVSRVNAPDSLRRRFIEMGIVKGERIRLDRLAPLGDPAAYLIKGYRLALRREEAAHIEVILQD